MKSLRLVALALCVAGVSPFARSAQPTGSSSETVKVGHLAVEKALFASTGNIDKKLAVCNECHGKNGAGDADFGPEAAFGTPALRGLTPEYMASQIEAYQTRTRSQAEMAAMVSLLSKEDALELSKAFAKLPAPAPLSKPQSKKFSASVIEAGEAIAQKGVKNDASTACVTCHQPKGVGLVPAFPRLAGQNAVYITNQLNAWRSGSRKDPSGAAMAAVASKLGPDDVKAVAAYFEAQLPR
jgi:cytochrome c553